MKVRDLVKFLMDFDMNADILLSTGDTFDDVEDLDIGWGGNHCGKGADKLDATTIYINTIHNNEVES